MVSFLKFFIKPPGVLLPIFLGLIGILYYVSKANEKKRDEDAKKITTREVGHVVPTSENSHTAPPAVQLQDRSLSPVSTPAPTPTSVPGVPQTVPVRQLALAAFYEDVQAVPEPSPTPSAHVPKTWLPASDFIPVTLVNTVQSGSRMNCPVLGLVTKDIYNNGHLIIPARTKVSTVIQTSAVNDRIDCSGEWLFVFPDGKSLKVPCIACMRESRPDIAQYDSLDGSPGLRGFNVESNKWSNAEALVNMLVMASVQAGTAATGAVLQPSHSGGGVGIGLPDTTPILEKQLDQLWNGQTGDGRFVQVPAGTPFYLFPTDTIFPAKRAVGSNSRLTEPDSEPALSPEAQAMQLMKAQQPTQNETQTPRIKY